MQTWVRHAIIRGDVAAAGIVTGLGGLILAVISGVAHDVAWMGLGMGLIVGGVGTVRWSRQRYRGMLTEVAARFASYEPPPNPVSWVSDEVWREANRFNPALDAPLELMSEVDDGVRPFAKDAGRGLESPHLRLVPADERDLVASVAPAEPDAPVQSGTREELKAALASTPGRFIAMGARFPVCCGALSVLVGTTPPQRPEGAVFLPATGTLAADAGDPDAGLHSFLCRRCGRAYATDPQWT